MFVNVWFNLPLKQSYTYRVEAHEELSIGQRCIVPFGRREMVGAVIELLDDVESSDYEVKSVKRSIDKKPLFGETEIALANWMSRFYLCSPGQALFTMLPSGRREKGVGSVVASGEEAWIEESLLSTAQSEAIASINSSQDRLHYLYGITGSGKSEVYFRIAQRVISQGQQVIYLVPEITLTHQLAIQVEARFSDRVAILHSALTASQRLAEWRRILNNEVDIVIGARSAIFAPCRRLGLIIIDEEHENSYKAGDTPRYHARQVAQKRASDQQAILLLGSATPSLEAYHMMEEGVLVRHNLPKRVAGGREPTIQVVSMLQEQQILSQPLLQEIEGVLSRQRQVILFLNRRGFSYFFHCKSCGYEMSCPHCSVSLTYHKLPNRMVCHYCGYRQAPITVCPACSSLDVGYAGFGTEMIEQEVRRAFPQANIARLDTDAAQERQAVPQILEKFRQGEIDLLLGTQMVAKGLNFPLVELVGVVNADSALNLPDFRAQERSFALIVQVSGRAGRYNDKGRVIVQTYRPENDAIICATTGRHEEFYQKELELRKAACFPPYSRLINFTFRSRSREKAKKAVEELAQLAERSIAEMSKRASKGEKLPQIFGWAPCPLEKIAGSWRYHLLLRGEEAANLLSVATYLKEQFPPPAGTYLEIDVDPLQLL